MITLNILLIIILVIWLIDMIYCPRIDKTRVGDILLYYGQPGNRKYIKLNIW